MKHRHGAVVGGVILLLLLVPSAVAGESEGSPFPITARCADGGFVSVAEIIDARIPSASDLQQVPERCKQRAGLLRDEFVRQDQADFQSLVNRACSAQRGWVERVPGTCSAGGPPPICKVDHWRFDPVNASGEFAEFNRKAKADRAGRYALMACNCWEQELQQQSMPAVGPPASLSSGVAGLTAVCVDGKCPPGFRCVNGLCREQVETQAVSRVPKSALIDQMRKRLPAFMRRRAFNAVLAFFDPVTPKTEKAQYLEGVGALMDAAEQYQRLDRQFNDPRIHPDTREGLRERFPSVCNTMKQAIDQMQIYYRGVVAEKQLGVFACYGVFQFQHQMMVDQGSALVQGCPAPNPFNRRRP